MSDSTPETDNSPKTATPAEAPPENQAAAAKYRAHPVKVGAFEGPLDLLLHLVRIHEIEITDIPIFTITEQYNDYLEMMRELNLDIAGEYLVMAATLMHIKSRMLLPPDPTEEEDEANDPRAELAQQLLEYQKIKQAAENLSAIDSQRNLIWTRDEVAEEFAGEELLVADLFDLLNSFKDLLGRLDEQARHEVMRDTVSVADKIHWLTELLERRPSIDLLALMADMPTKMDCLATFLALLELMRMRRIVAYQRKACGEIRITAVSEQPEPTVMTTEGQES